MSGTSIAIDGNSNQSNLVINSASSTINDAASASCCILPCTIPVPGFAGRQYSACFVVSPYMHGVDISEAAITDINPEFSSPDVQALNKYVQYTFSEDGKSYQLSFGDTPSGLFTSTAASGETVYGKKDIPLYESKMTPGIYLTDPLEYQSDTLIDPNTNAIFVDALTGYQQCGIQFSKAPGSDDPWSKMVWVGPSPLLQASGPVMSSFRTYYPKWVFDTVAESCTRFPNVFVRDPLNFIVVTDASGYVLDNSDNRVATGGHNAVTKIPNNLPKRADIWMRHVPSKTTEETYFLKMGPKDANHTINPNF
jgi:hypothetical protein